MIMLMKKLRPCLKMRESNMTNPTNDLLDQIFEGNLDDDDIPDEVSLTDLMVYVDGNGLFSGFHDFELSHLSAIAPPHYLTTRVQ